MDLHGIHLSYSSKLIKANAFDYSIRCFTTKPINRNKSNCNSAIYDKNKLKHLAFIARKTVERRKMA